jgi:Phosphotransferase enzyme family
MEISENPVRHEGGGPTVVMRNEPKLSEHEVDRKFNEMRLEFIPYIKQFVSEHELFKNESEVSIEFSHTGVSSIIAIIETPAAKWVLKIPRSKTFSAGEGQFLKVWEDAGVSVPHVVGTGELHGFPYTLMEFVDATTLGRKYSQEELLSKGVYVDMGQVLRLMINPNLKQ